MRGKTCPGMTQFVFLENMNGAMGRLWGEYLELVLQCAINRVR